MKPFTSKFFAYSSVITLLFLSNLSFSQSDVVRKKNQNPSFWDRVFLGGNLGLQFGTVTMIDISPLAGYKITDDFAAGIGFTYQYYSDNRYSDNFTTTIYGGRVFGRYYVPVVENLFLHAEDEILSYDVLLQDPYYNIYKKRVTANNFLVGGGYRQVIGGSSYMELMLLYNLNETEYSLYTNPIIRMGVSFGL